MRDLSNEGKWEEERCKFVNLLVNSFTKNESMKNEGERSERAFVNLLVN